MRLILVLLACLTMASPAWAAWHEARSAHFIIYSDDKPERLREFAEELERFDAGMRVLRGLERTEDSPNNRLTIFVVDSQKQIRELSGDEDAAAFYMGRAGGSVAFIPRKTGTPGDIFTPQVLLQHEYSHHFMFRNYSAAFPGWFVEGFAELSSNARIRRDGSIDFGLFARHRIVEVLNLWGLYRIPAEKLLSGGLFSGDAGAALYGRGWLLTHYLTFSKEREGQLIRYLGAVNKGTPPLDAARDAFGDFDQLDRELDRYARSRLGYFRISGQRTAPGPIDIRPLSEGAAAIMPVMIRSWRGVDDEAARKLVAEARVAAARWPADPFVQTALAEAEIDAGYLDEADAAAARALEADPGAIRALVFRGRVAIERLEKAGSADAAAWKAARQWFVNANRLEPRAPEPLIHYYQSFRDEGVEPTENAIQALYSAAVLAPEDAGLRLTVARQLFADGQPDRARAALAPVAYAPHGGGLTLYASALLTAVDEAGADLARTDWPKIEEAADAALKKRYEEAKAAAEAAKTDAPAEEPDAKRKKR